MREPTKRVLAYQQTPLVLTCVQSGHIPEDFLVTLTEDEQQYLFARSESDVESIFYELLPQVQAAGIVSTISHLLFDVHAKKPRVFARIDDISLPLAEEPGTQSFLKKEVYDPYSEKLDRLHSKTKQRFGSVHHVHLCLLPQFIDGKHVTHDIATFGEQILEDAVHEPEELSSVYKDSRYAKLPNHTWIGINKKMFATHTLRRELLDRLSQLRIPMVAEN